MTTAVIKRRAPARRPVAKKREPVPMVRVPVAAGRLWRHVAAGFIALALVASVVVAILLHVPERAWLSTAQAASRAGFEVRHVEVHGVANAPRLAVVTAALEGPTNSMLLVDLSAARARLRALSWVADASVARRLPDTLIVDIVERRPVALWQYHHKLAAVDRSGIALTGDHLDRFATLPLIVGAGANEHVDDLLALLGGQPRLAGTVDAATFVGQRRWDLRFKSGETLALPEGALAPAALAKFDALDRKTGMLGKGYVWFDLRQPGQMTVRVAAPVKPDKKKTPNKPVTI
ncbi:FtsQ-type POTRA domain-containing protein [Polymorphobacter sp. PAMC 29334]|uniref:cell division protein FtsQ/DivIB n=1 Tax=Polymorphobacter sp. PAMC 29334 TaxID=2862331 RepID=UPI001C798264|nr:FtsQ-type POTRA domain-containing protein [Polymorphobacter sp. PAMC 29334]QYE35086.1 FtsQ-type POTRA domain-containing protein [Polymorphobacter sp. PAMC 29334]